MSNTEIYIGDSLLDVSLDTVVAQTMKANDIGDLTTRNFNYTNQFKVPFTENNDRIYENARQHQSDTNVPYSKQVARIRQDGIDTIGNGVHYLKKASDGYEIFIISGAAAFFDKLGDNLLSDLDTTSIDAVFDATASRSSTSGVVSPVIDYGNYNTTTNDVDISTYPPSLYYFSIIDLIFSNAGYSKSGTIFSNAKYLSTIIPYSKSSYGYSGNFCKARNVVAVRTSAQVMGSVATAKTLTYTAVNKADDFGYFNAGTGIYTPTQSGASSGDYLFYTRVTLVIDFTITAGVGNVNVYMDSPLGDLCVFLQDKGTGVYSRSTDFADGTIPNPFGAVQGDYIKVEIAQFNLTPASVTVNSATITIECIPRPAQWLYYNELMPEIKQKELMLDFAFRYGQLFKENNGAVSCKGIDEVILDRANAKDWTLKRVRKSDQVSYTPDRYAQSNLINYNFNVEEGVTESYGQGDLTITNLNIPIKQTLYQSPFYSSLTKQVGGVYMMVVPIFDTSTAITKFDNEPGLRIALVRDKYSYEPNVIYSGSQSSYKVAYFEDPLQSNSMVWSQFLNDHYFYLSQILQKAKVIEREYNLSSEDIASLDFFVPIFDEDSYYLLNVVGPYVSQKKTKVELIKI